MDMLWPLRSSGYSSINAIDPGAKTSEGFAISWICLDRTDRDLERDPVDVPILAERGARKEGV